MGFCNISEIRPGFPFFEWVFATLLGYGLELLFILMSGA
jgi:hypothetical protein